MSLDKVKEKLDDLAVSILDAAAKETTPLPQRLDAFKFVQAYYVGVQKVNGKAGDSEPPGSTMEALRNSVAAPSAADQGDDEDDETGDSSDA